jgi:glutaredoxin
MKVIRYIVGKILLFLNSLTLPSPVKRDSVDQKRVETELKKYSLYQYMACPFCIKVRRALHRLNLQMEIRDAKEAPHKADLNLGGGRSMVPCLRIEEDGQVNWMYESSEIITFLDQKFGV